MHHAAGMLLGEGFFARTGAAAMAKRTSAMRLASRKDALLERRREAARRSSILQWCLWWASSLWASSAEREAQLSPLSHPLLAPDRPVLIAQIGLRSCVVIDKLGL